MREVSERDYTWKKKEVGKGRREETTRGSDEGRGNEERGRNQSKSNIYYLGVFFISLLGKRGRREKTEKVGSKERTKKTK